ncbi:MAG: PQQ-binding-like beta-propeller repeat protein, partial [bacterium]
MKYLNYHILIFIFLLFTICASAEIPPPEDLEILFREALYQEQIIGDIAKAVSLYRSIINASKEKEFDSSPAKLRLAMCYELIGETKPAASLYRQLMNSHTLIGSHITFVANRLAQMDSVLCSRLIWKSQLPDMPVGGPVIYESSVLVSTQNNSLHLFNLKDGRLKWTVREVSTSRASPGVFDGNVYIGSWKPNLIKIDLKTGRTLWKSFLSGTLSTTPIGHKNIIFAGAEGKFYAIENKNGNKIWSIKYNGAGWITTRPAIFNNLIIIWMPNGKITSFDMKTGKQSWSFTSNTNPGQLILSGKTILLKTDQGLTALDAEKGVLKWNRPDDLYAALDGDGTAFYGLTSDGSLFVLESETGRHIATWHMQGETMSLCCELICLALAGKLELFDIKTGE